jgi:class 3 adenylate cyclase
MESHGLPGTIQVTQIVHDRLEQAYTFQVRGEIPVKGKGNMLTYLLTGHKE